jgi:hypothetical protein
VSTWAEPRLTRDADLAVAAVDDTDAELLVSRLSERCYSVLAAVEQVATGRLGTVRLVRNTTGEGTVTDLLFALSGIESEIAEHAGAPPRRLLPHYRLRGGKRRVQPGANINQRSAERLSGPRGPDTGSNPLSSCTNKSYAFTSAYRPSVP